jgi:Kef-type K+ transport system membrane component KefB
MMMGNQIDTGLLHIPSSEPVVIFAIILLSILLSQTIFQKIKLPAIIGYILAGMALGPHGWGILQNDSSIQLFGTAGLLFIMFVAGLDLNLQEFKHTAYKSIVFGLLTFFIPLGLGFVSCRTLLHLEPLPSFLVSIMFSTHTLIAYPIVSRFGIAKNEAVAITIGGTIITDTLVLMLLAFIASGYGNFSNSITWLRIVLSGIIVAFLILWLYPKALRWLLRNIEGEKLIPLVFIFFMIFLAGILAKVASLEPIIGAFLAGLALNKTISGNRELMNNIELIGNTLFIPFFLIGVGMVIDPNLLTEGSLVIKVAVILTLAALIGKFFAAHLTRFIFKYSSVQGNLIFGLSSTHAAATLAVIFIGFNLGIIDVYILNGTIILILLTCLIGSIVADNASRKIHLSEEYTLPEVPAFPERILVPVANPQSLKSLIELAIVLKHPGSDEPIYPISIVEDNELVQQNILKSRKDLDNIIRNISLNEARIQPLVRVDVNIVSGIIRGIKETMASMIVMGWGGSLKSSERIFGSILQKIISETSQTIVVSKIKQSIFIFKNITILCPPNTEYESGFIYWVSKILILANKIQASLEFKTSKELLPIFLSIAKIWKINPSIKNTIYTDWESAFDASTRLKTDSLFIIVAAREDTISYLPVFDSLPQRLNQLSNKLSFILLFPEQAEMIKGTGVIPASEIHISPIMSQMENFKKLSKKLMKTLHKKSSHE